MRPFVSQGSRTAAFSPNGDGVKDTAAIGFTLQDAVSAGHLDVLDDGGNVVRTISLGARPAGANQAIWDGHLSTGGVAPNGRYLARITVTDAGGAHHSAPSPSFSTAALTRWGITVDRKAPTFSSTPSASAPMVPATATVAVAFSEPMVGLGDAAISLGTGGASLPAATSVGSGARSLFVRPDAPLPTEALIDVTLNGAVRDVAGNPPLVTEWSFTTAPGLVYDPARHGTLAKGTRTAFDIGANGDLLRHVSAWLGSVKGMRFAQRALMPNLPGRWLFAKTGPLAGHWLRETAKQHVDGFVSRTTYAQPQSIRLAAGTHVGYRFADDGTMLRTRSLSLASRAWASSSQRAVINGATYWRIAGGALDGYWVAQSGEAYRRGLISELTFSMPPRIDVARGTYTAYAYDSRGRVTDSLTAKLGSTTGIRVSAWAIINGTPRYLVSSGTWAGLWLADTKATTLHV
jgi:hypothetical protein